MPECSACGSERPKDQYSKAQLSKKALRKCKECVAASMANEAGAAAPPAATVASAPAAGVPAAGEPDVACITLEPCPPPGPRVYFSTVSTSEAEADAADIIIFGGELTEGRGRKATTKFFGDTFRFSAAAHTWCRWPRDAEAPSPRSGHHSCLAMAGSRMYTFGGEWANAKGTKFFHYNELWQLELATDRWSIVIPSGTVPAKRSGMRLAAHRECVLMFGGFADDGA
eukprot:SAG11_NODE_879_length_6759_cov_5.103904_1_plen_227_part_00